MRTLKEKELLIEILWMTTLNSMEHEPEYYIDKLLKSKWRKIRGGALAQADEDRVYVVDGRERSGKSVFTLQQAYYIDPTIIIPEEAKKRIVFNAEDFIRAIKETESTKEETKVIIFDEAFRGLSSRANMSKINKSIIQAMMEMGQKNLVVFIVLPTFFMLDLYPAMLRSNALFHIKKDKNNPKLRTFHVYNYQKKSLLYQIGVRKGWQYKIYTRYKGRFYGKYPNGDEFEKLYRSLKRKALDTIEKPIEKESYKSESNEKAMIFKNKQQETGMSQRELAKWWQEVTGSPITQSWVNQLLKKAPETPQNSIKAITDK